MIGQAANEDEVERILNNDDDFEHMFSDLFGDMARTTSLVNTVRCGAHTIQVIQVNSWCMMLWMIVISKIS